jgi:glyoxylase-like metal-dependent hydrolase (beta-lactamase superfamily II)
MVSKIARTASVMLLGLAMAGRLSAGEIAPGVELLPGRFVPGEQPDGNTVVFRTESGLVVVDTGRHPEHTQAIIDLAARLKLPVVAVVNTHWHLDHVAGNPALRRAFPGAKVFASNAIFEAQKGFLASYRAQLADAIGKSTDKEQQASWLAEVARIDAGPLLAPDEVVTTSGRRTIAGRTFDVELTDHAVTAADLWLFDPASGVLVAGDLVTLPVPLLDTACPAHWLAALGRLSKVDFRILVPGHGAPMRREQLETYRTAFEHLLGCAASKQEKAVCVDGWLHDAAALLAGEDPKWVRSLLDYYMDSSLRGDATRNARLCGQ